MKGFFELINSRMRFNGGVVGVTRHCGIKGVEPYYDIDTGLWVFARMSGFNFVAGTAGGGYVDLSIYPGPEQPIPGILPELEFYWRLHHVLARTTATGTARNLLQLTGTFPALSLGGRETPGYNFVEYANALTTDGYIHTEYTSVKDAMLRFCIPFCTVRNGTKLSLIRYTWAVNSNLADYELSAHGEILQTRAWGENFRIFPKKAWSLGYYGKEK